ncbi:MAG: hypothetical protein ACJ8GW_16715 [Massilia sp.]
MDRKTRQKNRTKWEADSNRYALNLDEKNKPHCLILFRHGGFFFSAWDQAFCEQLTGTPILSFLISEATMAEVLQS